MMARNCMLTGMCVYCMRAYLILNACLLLDQFMPIKPSVFICCIMWNAPSP